MHDLYLQGTLDDIEGIGILGVGPMPWTIDSLSSGSLRRWVSFEFMSWIPRTKRYVRK